MARKLAMKKDKWDDVPSEFKEALYSASDEEVKQKVAQIAIGQAELMIAKKQDQALEEAKEVYTAASAIYRDGTKANRLKIEFAHYVLESRGKA
jgi:hypothetical protein